MDRLWSEEVKDPIVCFGSFDMNELQALFMSLSSILFLVGFGFVRYCGSYCNSFSEFKKKKRNRTICIFVLRFSGERFLSSRLPGYKSKSWNLIL